jgi:hypothetical protein
MQARKIVSSVFVALAFLVALVFTMGGVYDIYIDLPTMLIVLLFPMLYQCALFGVHGFASSFKAPFEAEATPEELGFALEFFSSYGRATWLFTTVSCMLSAIRMLSDLVNYSMLGVYLAIILLGILYAAVFSLVLVSPYVACLRQRLAEREKNGSLVERPVPNLN